MITTTPDAPSLRLVGNGVEARPACRGGVLLRRLRRVLSPCACACTARGLGGGAARFGLGGGRPALPLSSMYGQAPWRHARHAFGEGEGVTSRGAPTPKATARRSRGTSSDRRRGHPPIGPPAGAPRTSRRAASAGQRGPPVGVTAGRGGGDGAWRLVSPPIAAARVRCSPERFDFKRAAARWRRRAAGETLGRVGLARSLTRCREGHSAQPFPTPRGN